jgi:predicted phage terminase large subunit-like protein
MTSEILTTEFSLKNLEAELYKRSLVKFSQKMWECLEPGRKFVSNWHIDAICEHLEAVSRREIRNLLINIPPRHMKSLLTSVFWPAWVWTHRPEERWLFSSYSHVLSKRDSLKTRRLLDDPIYQYYFGSSFRLTTDQNEKMKFENDKTGSRMATSVDGAGTGEGGDIICVDDPHKVGEGESQTKRENVLTWWDEVMSSRGNDPETFCKVIVMQRVHEKDLSGHVLEKGGYEHLCLPAEYVPKIYSTSIGWSDPRKVEKQLLWPQRFNQVALDSLKKELGSQATQSQLQQNPMVSEGGLFKREWWRTYRELPELKRIVQFWDTAQKVGITNDYSVCATWGEAYNGYYLLDIWRNKVEAPQLERAVSNQYLKFSPSQIVIEDKSSGSSLIQNLRQKTVLPIFAFDPKQRDKEVRASAITPLVESGRCFIPESAPWLEDFLSEHERFPNAEHDDTVDTTSCALEHLSKSNSQPRIRIL